MILLVFIVLGCLGIGRLPVSLIPDIDVPYVTVQVTARDMSARELDDAVVRPLRQTLVQIGHLKDVRAESKDGTASIVLSFEEGTDIDYSFIEVNEMIDRAMSSLPRMDRPKVFKASVTDIPAFYINMTLSKENHVVPEADKVLFPVSDEFREMSGFASDVIAKRIEQLPEVAMVDMTGGVKSEILVIPDEYKLRQTGITIDEFQRYVASSNVSLSNLTIRDGEYHFNVRFQSFASSAEDIADVYFRVGDRVLQIKDVARVIEHPARRTGMASSDGKDALVLAVIKQSEARMSDLKKSISRQLEEFAVDYPEMEFTMTRDQTELLDYSIKNLILNIILAILLDCIVIFLFMKDLRTPVLVSMTIPVSLVISIFVFYLLGLTINIISLSGLLLGVGMMVDNTIILTDNITARWQRGDSLRTSVVEGTREVSGAMLSSVLTTCAVFLPLIFLGGVAGSLFYDQAVAVTVVLLTSYIVTVVVIPVYYWAFYRHADSFKENPTLAKIQFKSGLRLYDRTVEWFLRNGWTAWLVPAVCLGITAVSVAFMPKQKLPPITYTDAVMSIDWNESITVEENRDRMARLVSETTDADVHTTTMVGVQQFVLGHSGDQSMSQSSLYVKCQDAGELNDVEDRMMQYVRSRYPSAIFSFAPSGNIFDMVFSEKDPELMARLRPLSGNGIKADEVRSALESIRRVLPGVNIEDVPLKTDVLYVSDPERMSLYGVSFSQLSAVLSSSLNGNTVFEMVQGDRTVPVVLGTDVREMDDILSSSFISNGEVDIPVRSLMRQTWDTDFKSLISGDDGDYYPVILDVPASEVRSTMAAVKSVLREESKFDASFKGSYFSNQEMMKQMALVLAIALAMLFLILASQFESLVQPFIILSEVIIDICLSLLALWLLGESINLMALIGLVVICGIVINDSILKIDTINRLVRSGVDTHQAIHEAGHRRIKSIIMTSLTTTLAVVPFLSRGNMGDDLQYPMALVIVVGMLVGTFVSLFFVPAVYSFIYRDKR